MSKITEIASSLKKELITHRSRLTSLKCKDMRHIYLKLPVELIDYLKELKKTQIGFNKTQFCIERFIDGFEINSLLTKPSKRHGIHLHFPEEILNLFEAGDYYRVQLIRNSILLGFEKYRNSEVYSETPTIKQPLNQEIVDKRKPQTYRVEMTVAKVLDFLEWVWDSESEGHYRPIIAPCFETIKYKISLTLLNKVLKETLERPVVITKLIITPN